MTDVVRLTQLQYGLHATAADCTTMPSPLKHLRLKQPVMWYPKRRYVDRGEHVMGDGTTVQKQAVGKEPGGFPSLMLEQTGLSGSGAGNGVSASTLSWLLDGLMECVFGEIANGTGDTAGGAPGSGTTVTMDGATSDQRARAFLFLGNTSAKRVAREVHAFSASTFSIDRALTTDAGLADTVAAASVAFASRSIYMRHDLPDRKHLGFDAEGQNFRDRVVGGVCDLVFRWPLGGIAEVSIENIQVTDWQSSRDGGVAEANPTYTEPTTGSPITVVDAPMWIGSTMFSAYNAELRVTCGWEARPAQDAPNGHYGFVATQMSAAWSWSMRAGTVGLEVDDGTIDDLNEGLLDVAFQFGRSVGRASYWRVPAMDVTAERVIDGGRYAVRCTGVARRCNSVASQFGNYMMRGHFF